LKRRKKHEFLSIYRGSRRAGSGRDFNGWGLHPVLGPVILGGFMMTSKIEQWSLIFCVIIPAGFYLMLALVYHVDRQRGIK